MSRGKFEYQWTPFADAPKHSISNEHLICMDQNGTMRLCVFENEQFKTLDGVPIENVVLYQNNESVANAIRSVEAFKRNESN